MIPQRVMAHARADLVLLGKPLHPDGDVPHQITSTNVRSMYLKNTNPPSSNTITIAVLPRIGAISGRAVFSSAHRHPASTPTMGFRSYTNRNFAGTRLTGYTTGD